MLLLFTVCNRQPRFVIWSKTSAFSMQKLGSGIGDAKIVSTNAIYKITYYTTHIYLHIYKIELETRCMRKIVRARVRIYSQSCMCVSVVCERASGIFAATNVCLRDSARQPTKRQRCEWEINVQHERVIDNILESSVCRKTKCCCVAVSLLCEQEKKRKRRSRKKLK